MNIKIYQKYAKFLFAHFAASNFQIYTKLTCHLGQSLPSLLYIVKTKFWLIQKEMAEYSPKMATTLISAYIQSKIYGPKHPFLIAMPKNHT